VVAAWSCLLGGECAGEEECVLYGHDGVGAGVGEEDGRQRWMGGHACLEREGLGQSGGRVGAEQGVARPRVHHGPARARARARTSPRPLRLGLH
jgi:hypothetical protein